MALPQKWLIANGLVIQCLLSDRMKKQMFTADATQQVIKVHLFRANGDNERRKHGGQDGEHDKAASIKQE